VDGSYYIAMEYVRGEDLRRIYNQEVARGRAMPLEPAAHIAMGAAAGLDYAHRQTSIDGRPLGIVHRDVSPQNILVTYDGHVKLVDFGVAKAEGKLTETRSGVLKGKYSYMSPEQASGDPIDGRTDVFALGITLYEVTTGVRLFKRENEIETLHAVIECSVTAPSELVPGYDDTMQEIVMRSLALDPDDRHAAAGDLERDLERFLVSSGHATSSSSLSAYMQDLFAEKLADELLFGGQPWDENMTPSRPPRTRKLGRSRSEPVDAADTTEIVDGSQDDTIIDQDSPSEPSTRRAHSAVWGAGSDWETQGASTSKTATHEKRRQPGAASRERSVPRSVLQPSPQLKSSGLFPFIAVALMLVGVGVVAAFFLVNKRRDLRTMPRSGMLTVDSEPRGARVEFIGPGADQLNNRYGGRFTPFTIREGLPVENALRVRFLKDGFEVAEVDMPELEAGVVPEPLFVELPTGEEGREPGALILLTTPPGATVWVDGNRIDGTTPHNDVRVRGGETHKVEAYLKGYESRWETVYVEPGSRRFIEMTLTPDKDATAGTPPGGKPPEPTVGSPGAPPSAKAKAKAKAPVAAASGSSYLTVTSPLKLRVTVDSRYVGETPVRRLELKAGVRRIKLHSSSEGFTVRRKVRLAAGRTETLDIKPRRGNLALNADPWAWVSVGKASPSETPVRLKLYEGEYAVLFECPDGRRKRENARVVPGQTTSLSVSCR
ncbi:MAG: serine/threonine-protein kinase, partial [Myxococcota bacterium]